MKRAIIFGTAEFAEVAMVYLRDDSDYKVEGFTVDERFIDRSSILGFPVIPFERLSQTHPASEFSLFLAIGYSKVNANRRTIYETAQRAGYATPSYIHSSVHRWPETSYGEACFIFEDNVIQPFVSIGNNCVLWSGNHIGHHTKIGDNVFIASHVVVSGNCQIGDNCFIGVNATFRDGAKVGANGVIGAGAVVLRDTIEGGVYKSVNTEPQERRSDELRRI